MTGSAHHHRLCHGDRYEISSGKYDSCSRKHKRARELVKDLIYNYQGKMLCLSFLRWDLPIAALCLAGISPEGAPPQETASGIGICSHHRKATTGPWLLCRCCRVRWLRWQRELRTGSESRWGWPETHDSTVRHGMKKKRLILAFFNQIFGTLWHWMVSNP